MNQCRKGELLGLRISIKWTGYCDFEFKKKIKKKSGFFVQRILFFFKIVNMNSCIT
jgi:hypothetical protein